MSHRGTPQPSGHISRRSMLAIGLTVLTVSSCVSAEANSEGTTIRTTVSSNPDLAPTTSSADLTDEVRRAFAEDFETPLDRVVVGDPMALAPSTCTAVGVWENALDAGSVWYLRLGDGRLIQGNDDETLGQVMQSCFLDEGKVPNPDTAVSLVLNVGPPQMAQPVSEASASRVLGRLGVEWEAPAVVTIDDGFDIAFYGMNAYTLAVYHVTSRIRPGEAKTDYRRLN